MIHEFTADAREANRIANQLRGGNRATKAPAPRWPHAPAAGGKLTALTPVQIEILAFMREYLAENDQLPPVAQVGAKFGFHTNGAQWHLAELGRKGALEKNAAGRWRFARGDTRTGDLFEGSMLILGIDPGANTGVAHFVDGELARLETIAPHQIERTLRDAMPARVVFEDSRLQSHTWTRGKSGAASAKMARNVGQVDAWCTLITSICGELGIPAHGISPANKGEKLDHKQFQSVTGWAAKSNQHERDAAMVAWRYRRAV